MHCAQWLHPQKLLGHVQCLQESFKLGRLSPETPTAEWHRPGEELGTSRTEEPSTHASQPSVWDRLGEGSEASGPAEAAASWSMWYVWHRLGESTQVSRTGEATMHCSVTSAWRRPGGGPRAFQTCKLIITQTNATRFPPHPLHRHHHHQGHSSS